REVPSYGTHSTRCGHRVAPRRAGLSNRPATRTRSFCSARSEVQHRANNWLRRNSGRIREGPHQLRYAGVGGHGRDFSATTHGLSRLATRHARNHRTALAIDRTLHKTRTAADRRRISSAGRRVGSSWAASIGALLTPLLEDLASQRGRPLGTRPRLVTLRPPRPGPEKQLSFAAAGAAKPR